MDKKERLLSLRRSKTRIRDEINFDSVEALKQAIQEDEKFARAYLKSHE